MLARCFHRRVSALLAWQHIGWQRIAWQHIGWQRIVSQHIGGQRIVWQLIAWQPSQRAAASGKTRSRRRGVIHSARIHDFVVLEILRGCLVL
jgi:hypothetical protein